MTVTATAALPDAAPTENHQSERRLAFMLVAPAVILMLTVTAYPIGYAAWLSLQRYNLAAPAATEFIGLANYQTIRPTGCGGRRWR
jgi:multiple sugar transport system permease protein